MNEALFRVLLVCVLSGVLAGCPQQNVRDGDSSTGNLGSPLARPSPADVYIELSAAYLQENQLEEAYKNANKAVIVDPSSSNAFYVLALVQQRLGQVDAAAQSYRKSVSLGPRNPVALNAYGSFLCARQQYDEADKQFRLALSNPLYNTPWLALHNAGACKEKAGELEPAEHDYRSALQRNSRFGPSLLAMARVSFAAGNYLSSRAYLQRYSEVANHTAESLWLGVRTENQLGDREQMASYRSTLRARFPDSHEARYLQSLE